ncbi:T-cell differentiation antigen CD6 isoform X5 [Rousettus aegyptiacus]|uniref:T-cell differentiation antigen CD6 isoform X5 n=1 Tax=Rousettus aegyptiacus TaxID=9407 RepID=UPI00168D0F96|nr:T-cell differentiation antigen CD6 isoform X5 [Rousettus aegyptiacus]
MALDTWFFFLTAGLLPAALSGHPSPAPSGQLNTSSAESQPLEPGEQRGVRLVNGSSRCNGTVEVRLGRSWQPVCEALWNHYAAEAVCRALDCGGAAGSPVQPPPTPELPLSWALGNASRALNATQALAPAILCSGGEWQLCVVAEHACIGNQRPAQVTCAEHRALRLVDGGSSCAGRVEMLEYGQWGSVCDDTWDLEDAHVVCRQLSCGWAIQALPGLHFAPGRGLIHRDQVNCSGAEDYLWDCPGLPGDGYCGHKEDAGVICSGSRSLLNLSTSEVPASVQPVTVEPSVTVKTEESRELILLILCIILGILFLGSLLVITVILLKVKGKYALPAPVNHQHLPNTPPAGVNSYQEVPITIPKEEVPKMPIQVQAPAPEDSDSDSDYEHYDFSAQPPVALTTFYNSQRHRVTEEEVRQNRFQMPPLEEEDHASQAPPVNLGHRIADPLSLGPQQHPRGNSESSTSSGEDYCNSPSRKLPPWNPPGFSSERAPLLEPPNLELTGSRATFSGPSADDSSSTSSGEWYQNYKPPPQPPPMEQFGCPGSPSPRPDSTDNDDYDDIGAA